MADCVSTTTSTFSFPNASTMEQLATNYSVIWREICAIMQAILAASSQCQVGGGRMCTVVGGNTPMTFVGGVSNVTVVSGGTGYVKDVPTIAFVPPIGVIPGSIATGTVTTNGGNIMSVGITSGGSGYQPVHSTLGVSSVLGVGAILQPLVNAAGQIVNVNIVNGGANYTIADSVIATRAVLPNIAYIDATFLITSVSVTGAILDVAILNPGSGYQDSKTEVKIVSTLNPAMPYPLGGGFIGTVLTDPLGVITGVLINNTGSGYNDFLPYLVIVDPGTGAQTKVNLSGTSVASIDVIFSGSQYTSTATGYVLNPPTAALPNPPAIPAVVTINTSDNTFGTIPYLYWEVWNGTITYNPIQVQLNSVLSYFINLGYTISIENNPLTGNTIQWKICW